MSGPRTTLLIEGSFRELVEELVDYIDNLKRVGADTASSSLRSDVTNHLERLGAAEENNDVDEIEAARDQVLDSVVASSGTLNTAPEKEIIAAYNLLIHLIQQSPNVDRFLPPICRNLSSDFPSSPNNKFSVALSVLSTIFNVLAPGDPIRYPVFSAVLDVVSKSTNYDALRPQLKHVEAWLSQWQVTPAQRRKMYLRISGIAKDFGEEGDSYEYLIRALRTVSVAEASGEEARKLSIEALRTALKSPTHFDFEDLTSLDSVQALRNSDAIWFELLEIFTAQLLDDYVEFKEEHEGWIEEQNLDDSVMVRKMRLLTLASLAASTGQTRSLPYATIAKALRIPSEDVEMWVIDVIRAGLVEGKLSQLNQTFLIHRSTYRVFTQTQWREVGARLDMWRTSLLGVLGVIKQEKENLIAQREQEMKAAESKVNGATSGSGGGGGYRRPQRDNAGDFSLME